MRILHVIYSVDGAEGGPPLIATRLAAAQAGLGHDVALAAYDPLDPPSAVTTKLPSVPHGSKVKLIWFGRFRGLEAIFARRSAGIVRGLLPSYDFVHLHSVWNPNILAAAGVCRRARKPYSVLLNGILDPWSLAQSRWKKLFVMAVSARTMLNHAAFLHCGNTDEVELIKPLGLTSRTEIIPNGVFIEEFEKLPPPGTFHAKHPELRGQRFILFLSRVHYKKGLDYLADAFAVVAKQRNDVRLVVAGPDEGYRATFEQMIATHKLADRVHVVGPLYAGDKFAAFRDAACFCLPSRQEGFSVAITEALAAGLPCVVSRDCHYPEVAQVGAGEVTALNAAEVGAALLRVLDHPRPQEMSEAGRTLIRTRFNWPMVAKRCIEAYETALRL